MSVEPNGLTSSRESAQNLDKQSESSFSYPLHEGNCSFTASQICNQVCLPCKYCSISVHTQGSANVNYLLSALLILTTLFILSPLQAEEMVKGSAIVTTRSGSTHAKNASGECIPTATHEILNPSGLTLSTIKDAHIFLTFSNGVALAMNEESVVECTDYIQRPFDKEDQARGLEPSVSNLKLRMLKGQIAVASNRLSPLSEIRIQLPKGELRLHKGCCLIRLNTTGLHITAYEGILTYYYPNSQSREFISAPKGIRISEQSMERLQVAENTSVEEL